ncbi:histidine phosphatase family protein [bacterium]|nr:histidine phosphatase family protein [bacterium]
MSAAPQYVSDETELAAFVRAQGSHCLIVGRHEETQWNAEGRLLGQQDTPLNGRGFSQAQTTARFLKSIPLLRVHSSTLRRSRDTADAMDKANITRPDLVSSDMLKEIALGILEGEFKDQQSTAELTRYYQDFCKDEIHYRVPDGENLHDVAARVQRFFEDDDALVDGSGVHLIVGHRNVNKMILKHLLELSFDEGFRVEQEHQRLYFYFGSTKQFWSVWVEAEGASLIRGYATTEDNGYA